MCWCIDVLLCWCVAWCTEGLMCDDVMMTVLLCCVDGEMMVSMCCYADGFCLIVCVILYDDMCAIVRVDVLFVVSLSRCWDGSSEIGVTEMNSAKQTKCGLLLFFEFTPSMLWSTRTSLSGWQTVRPRKKAQDRWVGRAGGGGPSMLPWCWKKEKNES